MSKTPLLPRLPAGPPPGDYFTRLHAAINDFYRQLRDRIEGLVTGAPTTTFTVVTDINWGTGQKKTRTITVTEGIVTDVGTESGWT